MRARACLFAIHTVPSCAARTDWVPSEVRSFPSGKGRHRHIAKAVDTVCRNNPQVALSILIEAVDVITGEAIGAAKAIYLILINPEQLVIIGSNPKSPITID